MASILKLVVPERSANPSQQPALIADEWDAVLARMTLSNNVERLPRDSWSFN
jgi:hypothetical protein